MRTVQAAEAKTHLLSLLDDVENGETVSITRRGKRIACLVPDVEIDGARVEQAIKSIEALRRRVGKMTIEEILAAKNEGRA